MRLSHLLKEVQERPTLEPRQSGTKALNYNYCTTLPSPREIQNSQPPTFIQNQLFLFA